VDAGVYTFATQAGAVLTDLILDSGAVNVLDAGFTAAVAQPSLSWTLQGSQFGAYAQDVNPNATTSALALEVLAQPGAITNGPIGLRALVFQSYVVPTGQEVVLGGRWGNPFPSTWSVAGDGLQSFRLTYPVPALDGGTVGYTATASITYQDALADLPGGDAGLVGPTISPPTGITLDGDDWTSNQTLQSDTPVLTWSAPTLGNPTYFQIVITELNATEAGNVQTTTAANIYTTQLSVQVFPGLFVSGHTYYILARAVDAPNIQFASQPLLLSYPWRSGDALSGLLTAP
jgi:hypothetical protein